MTTHNEEMSMLEVAELLIQRKIKPQKFEKIAKEVCEIMGLTDEQFQSKLAQFYTDLTLSGKFVTVGEDKWDLKSRQKYEVIKLMGEFPMVIADAAAKRKPHLICNYINDLATAFHSLYNAEKVINEENTEKTNEKLALIKALEVTIKNALELIGVDAPERM